MTVQMDALERMRELIGGDAAVMAELVDSYLEETTPLVEGMRLAIRESDTANLARAAHTLKSTARDFGAIELSSLCQSLETGCKAATPTIAMAHVEAIARALASSQTQLLVYRSKLVSEGAIAKA